MVSCGKTAKNNNDKPDSEADTLPDTAELLSLDSDIISIRSLMEGEGIMVPRVFGEGAKDVEADIRKFIYSQEAIINKCYFNEQREHPDLIGKITLFINLFPSGKVKNITVTNNTIGNKVKDCTLKTIEKMTFPSKGMGPLTIHHTFVFTPPTGGSDWKDILKKLDNDTNR
jgi:hypothetical protein